MTEVVWVATLFDDASVHKKLEVMDKWSALLDDSRNAETDMAEQVEEALQLGKTYRITIKIEEIVECDQVNKNEVV